MNTFEKIMKVMAKNLGYSVLLLISIVLFAIFADGLLGGIITALSALMGYVCIRLLYVEYKKIGTGARTTKPAAGKKPTVKKKK